MWKAYQLLFLFLCPLMTYGQITVNFKASQTEGCGSLQVQFTDCSSSTAGPIVAWDWDLAGVGSASPNPGRIFGSPGSYTICLTVTDAAGNVESLCITGFIQVYSLPEPAFILTPNSGCVPLSVSFTDVSLPGDGSLTNWIWGVGGDCGVVNTTTAGDSFSCTYNLADEYTISLTVFDENGCFNTVTQPNSIEVFNQPNISIQANNTSSCVIPFDVQFSIENPEPNVAYFWSFGNGGTASGTLPAPVTYDSNGVYSVTVIAENQITGCVDTAVFNNFIAAGSLVGMDVTPTTACIGTVYSFIDNSPEQADSILWEFGDGFGSTSPVTSHTYPGTGCFTVVLTRYIGNCVQQDSIVCIAVNPEPDLVYAADNLEACSVPHTVNFTSDELQGLPGLTWSWDFGDGDSSFIQNPSHVYDAFGTYDVNLTVRDSNGCSEVIFGMKINIQPLAAMVSPPMIGGCAPYSFTLADSSSSLVPITTWNWSFSTPSGTFTSTDSAASFTVPDTGTFDLTFIVTNQLGCSDTIFLADYIQVGMPPDISFMGTPLQICVEESVQFFDSVSPYVDLLLWDFDGNGTIDGQGFNPAHVYDEPGLYGVGLTAVHNGCFNSFFIPDYVNVLDPLAQFSIIYDCGNPNGVMVINESIGADSVFWDMGDGMVMTDTSSSDTFFYTYPDTGLYIISLSAFNFSSGCSQTSNDFALITSPLAAFSISDNRGCAPYFASLTNESIFDVSRLWSVTGGTFTNNTGLNPLVVFENPGIYTDLQLIVTDVHGCQDTAIYGDTIFVNDLNPGFFTIPNPVCLPSSVTLVDTTQNLFSQNILWEWVVGDSLFVGLGPSFTFFMDSVGTFDVQLMVSDSFGCTVDTLFEDRLVASDNTALFLTDPLSCTGVDVSFTNLSLGEGLQSNWDFGDGTSIDTAMNPMHVFSSEGVFSVCLTIVDENGCLDSFCQEIVISDPVADFTADSTYAFCPPLITSFTNLSTNAGTFLWDFGDSSGVSNQVNPLHVYTLPGSYDVTLIAGTTPQCQDTLILMDFVVIEGPLGGFTFEIDTSCLPVEVTFEANSNDFYLYIWDYGDGSPLDTTLLANMDSKTHSFVAGGTFFPQLTLVDNLGCRVTLPAPDTITIPDLFIDFEAMDSVACGALNTTFINLSTSSENLSVPVWSFENGNPASSNAPSPIVSFDVPGTHDVTLVMENSFCRDSLIKPDYIQIGDSPVAAFDIQPDIGCPPLAVQFTDQSVSVFGAINFWLWDFGNGNIGDSANVSSVYSTSGVYTVSLIVGTEFECMDTIQGQVTILDTVPIQVSEEQTICIGNSVQLEGLIVGDTTNLSYFWSPTADLSCTQCLTPVASPTDSTVYTFTVVNTNGCPSTLNIPVNVRPFPAPVITLTEDTTICGGDVIQLFAEGGTSVQSYNWDPTQPGLSCYSACNNPIASPLDTTTYTITVSNSFGCISEDSVTISVIDPHPDIIDTNPIICLGNSTILEANTSLGINPVWTPTNGLSCTFCYMPTASPVQTTVYTISMLSMEGCIITDTAVVTVYNATDIDAGDSLQVCVGESVMLEASGPGEILWSPSSGLDNDTLFTPLASPQISTWYLAEFSAGECVLYDSVFVEVISVLSINATDTVACAGQAIVLEVEGNAETYTWSPSSFFENSIGQSQIITLTDSATFMIIGSSAFCEPDTAFMTIGVNPLPPYQAIPDQVIFPNEIIQLDASIDDEFSYSYIWSPPFGLSCQFCPAPLVEINNSVLYDLFIINDSTGCSVSDIIQVIWLNECPDNLLFVPNVFSPNNDGMNDALLIGHQQVLRDIESFFIFDRWGNRVYSSRDIDATWDGMFNGQEVPPGVYVYILQAICPVNQTLIQKSGSITLIR